MLHPFASSLHRFHRERPAAISIEIKSIDDTSNFDDFPESDILQPGLSQGGKGAVTLYEELGSR